MSDEKLIKKFLSDKNHITVGDCCRLLTTFGFKLRKRGGSHQVYHKEDEAPITVINPKKMKYVKPAYVNLIIKRLKLED
jgi:predicted RNA binding protein YcfA (HicA-like mRNA interferase family)